MKLGFDIISSIVKGAARVEEQNDGSTSFFRFTKEQEEYYRQKSDDLYKKTFASAGIRLEFVTDSTTLDLKFRVTPASSRPFYNHDVFVNDSFVGSVGERFFVSDTALIPPSEICETFLLGTGEKTVRIYLPWSFSSTLCHIALDDGAFVRPAARSRRMIAFGDSITHGYDNIMPAYSYVSRLSDMMDAEALNKGIGAEKFSPELALLPDDFEPDFITVAYGTNDWNCDTREVFEKNCAAFFENLTATYPNAKIYALAPIWRSDWDEIRPVGRLGDVCEYLRQVCTPLGITVIDCFDFVPGDPSFFGDKTLHPNDAGSEHYANNLLSALVDA